MSTIIMDLCSYTRLGLSGYLVSRGVKKREINDIETVDELAIACGAHQPSVVFINEDCFIHTPSDSQQIKQIINQHPDTLFIVFMAIANVHFDEYLLVRKNLLISSKSIKPDSLDTLLGDILKKESGISFCIIHCRKSVRNTANFRHTFHQRHHNGADNKAEHQIQPRRDRMRHESPLLLRKMFNGMV